MIIISTSNDTEVKEIFSARVSFRSKYGMIECDLFLNKVNGEWDDFSKIKTNNGLFFSLNKKTQKRFYNQLKYHFEDTYYFKRRINKI